MNMYDMKELKTMEEFCKIHEALQITNTKFSGVFCLEICKNETGVFYKLLDDHDADYFCAEGSIDDILNYLLDF